MKMYKAEYWDKAYNSGKIGWDAKGVSTPIKEYFDQVEDKNMRILIPGAGNAYEVEYLFRSGFTNVFLLDFAIVPIENFKKRVADFPEGHILHEDFFKLNTSFDIIVELAFLTSFHYDFWEEYARKMHELLSPKGKLIGVLFNHSFGNDFPPFAATVSEYSKLFSPYFDFTELPVAYNSIKPSKGREVFLKLVAK